MNKVILAGRLARDPEVRYTQTGKAVATFALAVNRRGRSADGQTNADFVPIVVWDKLAEICKNYLVKGSQILLEGRLQIRSYDAQDGSKRYVTEVIAQDIEFMGSKPTGSGYEAPAYGSTSSAPAQPATSMSGAAASFGSEVPPDEDIPF